MTRTEVPWRKLTDAEMKELRQRLVPVFRLMLGDEYADAHPLSDTAIQAVKSYAWQLHRDPFNLNIVLMGPPFEMELAQLIEGFYSTVEHGGIPAAVAFGEVMNSLCNILRYDDPKKLFTINLVKCCVWADEIFRELNLPTEFEPDDESCAVATDTTDGGSIYVTP